MSRVSSLQRLQVLDTELDGIRSRLQEIDRVLSSSPEVETARQEALLAERDLKGARGALRDLEDQTGSQKAKLEETTRRLYGGEVRNPKELLDLQSEENALRNHIATLEEHQLEQMIAVDERKAAADRAQSHLNDVEAQRQIQSANLSEEKQELLLRQETLEAQRGAGIAVVNAEDLQVYARARKTHHGLAVARIEGGACGACGVAPSQAQIEQARPGNQIVFCGNCGRILYAG
jgi:predicted  nucleic acid-binding Zn-ribbon protein